MTCYRNDIRPLPYIKCSTTLVVDDYMAVLSESSVVDDHTTILS